MTANLAVNLVFVSPIQTLVIQLVFRLTVFTCNDLISHVSSEK